MTDNSSHPPDAPSAGTAKPLAPAAVRALEEARRRREQAAAGSRAAEVGGPDGPEPTRYGDWERNGIASDF